MKKYKNRAEVEEKYKWDLSDFFKDENGNLICDMPDIKENHLTLLYEDL